MNVCLRWCWFSPDCAKRYLAVMEIPRNDVTHMQQRPGAFKGQVTRNDCGLSAVVFVK